MYDNGININLLYKSIIAVLAAIIGSITGLICFLGIIPFFYFIPLLLMYIFIVKELGGTLTWFALYIFSVIICYLPCYYMYIPTISGLPIIRDGFNMYLQIIISIFFAILCNWLVFKNQYKELGV